MFYKILNYMLDCTSLLHISYLKNMVMYVCRGHPRNGWRGQKIELYGFEQPASLCVLYIGVNGNKWFFNGHAVGV